MKLPFDCDNTPKNLLPYDGEVFYYEHLPLQLPVSSLFDKLTKEIQWKSDVVTLFGKTYTTKRKMALYADLITHYTYSNQQKVTLNWINTLKQIKASIELFTQEQFNCCLCNFYQNGSEGMGWHTDNESDLVEGATIASLSLGASRYFHFKHRETKEVLKFKLENGSLLLMKGETQKHWIHTLPKSKKINTPRINLTFRTLSNI